MTLLLNALPRILAAAFLVIAATALSFQAQAITALHPAGSCALTLAQDHHAAGAHADPVSVSHDHLHPGLCCGTACCPGFPLLVAPDSPVILLKDQQQIDGSVLLSGIEPAGIHRPPKRRA